MKRTRSLTPAGRGLKRRKAMTKDEAKVFTETSTAVLTKSIVPRGMPSRMYAKLRYFEQVTLDPVGGGASALPFRINSCYDPYQPAGGHKPRGLNQYFDLYDKAVVTSAKIVVKCVAIATTAGGLFGISLRNDTVTSSTPVYYVEDPHSVHAALTPYDPNQEVTLVYRPTWFGDAKRDAAQEDDELHFTVAADASKQCFAHVWMGALNSGHDPSQVSMEVLIEYNVCFFEPNTLPLS